VLKRAFGLVAPVAAAATLLVGCAPAHRASGGILVIEVSPRSGDETKVPPPLTGAMTVGERLEVRLGAYAGTGYRWILAGPVPANLHMTTGDPAGQVAPTEGASARPGGATMTTFGMTATAQGEARMRFELARPWEQGEQAVARRVDVVVDVRPQPAMDPEDASK
jgi:predicted secreted protein